jgi:hypothetical protein
VTFIILSIYCIIFKYCYNIVRGNHAYIIIIYLKAIVIILLLLYIIIYCIIYSVNKNLNLSLLSLTFTL